MAVDHHQPEDNRIDALLAEYMRLVDAGQRVEPQQFLRENAADSDELRELLATAELVEQLAGPVLVDQPAPPEGPAHEETVELRAAPATDENASEQGVEDTFVLARSPTDLHRSRTGGGSGRLEPCEFDDYTLLEMIGRGGMGVVYKARQRGIDRIVAVKMIADGRLASESDLRRFYTEFQAAGKLEHPNIVRIYHAGEVEGHCYFSMDYIEGTDLARMIQQGPLAPRRAARYLKIIAEAVQFAHDNGVLHRDLKPANVLVDEHDRPLITDFGLAKQLDRELDLTATGAALGTPSYMAPEQAAGRTESLGTACDVYSLGAILYALLTGQPPFRGASAVDTIFAVIHDNPVAPRKLNPCVDRDLETICLRSLHKDPARRYPSARELAQDLQRYLRGDPIRARPIGAVRRAALWLRDVPLVAAISGRQTLRATPAHHRAQGVVILGAILLVIGFISWRIGRQHILPPRIVVSSGMQGQMYYDVCQSIAPVLQNVAGRPVDVLESRGSEENVRRVAHGKAHVAIAQAETLIDEVSEIGPLYFDVVHVVAVKDSSIENITDLAGHRVSIGPELSGMRRSASKLLRACGVDPESLQESDVPFTQLLVDPSYDAAIITTGFDNADRNRLLKTGRFRLVPFNRDQLRRLMTTDFKPFVIETGDVPEEVDVPPEGLRTVATTAYLIVHRDASDRLVRTVLESLYQDYRLFQQHDILISRSQAAAWGQAHWHPAAQRFFKATESQHDSAD